MSVLDVLGLVCTVIVLLQVLVTVAIFISAIRARKKEDESEPCSYCLLTGERCIHLDQDESCEHCPVLEKHRERRSVRRSEPWESQGKKKTRNI